MALPRHLYARGGRYIDDSDLRASVGNGLANRPDDVMKVETLLAHEGRFDWSDGEGPIGIMTAPLP